MMKQKNIIVLCGIVMLGLGVSSSVANAYFPLLPTNNFQSWYKGDKGTLDSTNVSTISGSEVYTWKDSFWDDTRFDLTKQANSAPIYFPAGVNFNPTLLFDSSELSNYHSDNTALQGEHMIFAVVKPYTTQNGANTIINGQCPNNDTCPRPDFFLTQLGHPQYFAGGVGYDNSVSQIRYGTDLTVSDTSSILNIPTLLTVQSNAINPDWNWVYDHPLSDADGLQSRAFIKKNGLDIGTYQYFNSSQWDDNGIPREYTPGAGSRTSARGYQIGYDFINGNSSLFPFHGEIAEIIVYKGNANHAANDTSVRSIESYLAVKYGLTLNQVGAGQDYIDGSGSVVWNAQANSGYNKNIFGIGRDDNTSLYQKQSQSINTGVLTIALDNLQGSNQDNVAVLSDQNFLVGGDNEGALDLSETYNGVVNSRLGRVWKFQKIGGDNLNIQFVFTGLDAGIHTNTLSLVVSDDGVFDGSDVSILLSGDRANLTIDTSSVYVTLAGIPPVAPTIIYPGSGDTITNSTPTITGTGEIGAMITLTLSGQTYTGIVDGTGNWSIPMIVSLVDGEYMLVVTAINNYGGGPIVDRVFYVDTQATVTIDSPISGATMTGGSTISVTGSSDPYSLVTVTVNGNTYSGYSDGSGGYTISVLLPVIAGNYTITAQATDPHGNNSVLVDTTIVIVAPPSQGTGSTSTGTVSTGFTVGFAGGGGYESTSTHPTPTQPTQSGSIYSTDIFNSSIKDGVCYTRGTMLTIYQGNDVTEAFRVAHQMLYSYGLTKWQGTLDYDPTNILTREQAARFMVEFAKNILCRTPQKIYSNNFTDLGDADSTLVPYIRKSYEYGIFQGDNGASQTTFRPKDIITKDEFAAIIVRLVTSEFDEGTPQDWASNYRYFLETMTPYTTLKTIQRSNVAEVLYDVYKNNNYKLENIGYIIQK